MTRIARWVWVATLLVACGKAETSPGSTAQAPREPAASSAEPATTTPPPATATAIAIAPTTGGAPDGGLAPSTPAASEAIGTLVVAKPGVKSVEAYLGRFKLVDGDREVRIFTSDKVSEEALEKWAGKKVRVRGEAVAPSDPDPMEQSPMGPDGKPMKRPGGVRATSIEAAK